MFTRFRIALRSRKAGTHLLQLLDWTLRTRLQRPPCTRFGYRSRSVSWTGQLTTLG